MDGTEAAQVILAEANEHALKPPVIVALTAHAFQEGQQRCLQVRSASCCTEVAVCECEGRCNSVLLIPLSGGDEGGVNETNAATGSLQCARSDREGEAWSGVKPLGALASLYSAIFQSNVKVERYNSVATEMV